MTLCQLIGGPEAWTCATCGREWNGRDPTRIRLRCITFAEPPKLDPLPWPAGITVGVTAFNRPRHLRRFLDSLWGRYPAAPVIVADNGSRTIDMEDPRCLYLRLPFDVGLSASRNAIVERLTTPRLLLAEDDFIVDERCDLGAMVDVLDHDRRIGVVGGAHERGYRGAPRGEPRVIDADGMAAPLTTGTLEHTASGVPFTRCEWVPNFALFRRDMLADHRWRDALKVGEHTAYYVDVRTAGRWQVAYTDASRIGHDSDKTDPRDYVPFRARAIEFVRQHFPASKATA